MGLRLSHTVCWKIRYQLAVMNALWSISLMSKAASNRNVQYGFVYFQLVELHSDCSNAPAFL